MKQKLPLPPAVRGVFFLLCVLLLLTGVGYVSSIGNAKSEAEAKKVDLAKPNDLSTPEGLKAAQAAAGMMPEMDFSTRPKETMARMRQCAKKSGGDFNKLTIPEQKMFNTVTAGHGAKWLKYLAQHPEQ